MYIHRSDTYIYIYIYIVHNMHIPIRVWGRSGDLDSQPPRGGNRAAERRGERLLQGGGGATGLIPPNERRA